MRRSLALVAAVVCTACSRHLAVARPSPSPFPATAAPAPRVVLEATHENVLKYAPLSALKRHALDLN